MNLFLMHLLSFIMLNKYVSIWALSYIAIYPLSIYPDFGKESGYQLPKKVALGLGRKFPPSYWHTYSIFIHLFP